MRLWAAAWLLILAAAVAGCAAPATQRPTTPATYSDPWAYCQAVGTIDKPDASYTGAQMPPALAEGLHKALALPTDVPTQPLEQNSFFRCMDGNVYACTVGANLPCEDKADTSKEPNQGMTDYCAANPSSDFIPAYITGHSTVYEWRCTAGTPAVVKQVWQVDRRGFVADIWYEIPPQAGTK